LPIREASEVIWPVLAALASGLAILTWRSDPGRRLRPPGAAGRLRAEPLWAPRVRGALVTAGTGLFLVFGLGWWGVAVALGLGVVSYLVLGHLTSGQVARRRARLTAQLPQACDLLAVCLEAGLPLRHATRVIAAALDAPLADALGELAAKVRLGAEEATAWRELGLAEPALANLGREVARALCSGVALARSLRSLGVDARRDAASAAEVGARRVGVRSVLPLMLCFLPAFLLLGVVPIIGGVAQHLMP
jgi:pilus assembly protein TadC